MAETDAQIRISAIGGDEAAAALNKPLKAMENIGATHNDLVDKFSHRFEHIGLQLFAGEALRANGVGMETRQVVGTLQLALTSLSGAFGAAAMPIFLVAGALTALIGIYGKIKEHTEKTRTELEKNRIENEKTITTTDKSIEALEKYKATLGTLPPYLQDLLTAQIKLRDATMETQVVIDKQLLPALEKKTKAEEDETNKLLANLKKEEAAVKQLSVLKEGMQGYTLLERERRMVDELTMAYHKSKEQYATDNAALVKMRADIIEYEHRETKTIEQRAEEAEKASKANIESMKKESDEETERYQHWAELHAKKLKQDEEMNKQFVEHAKSAIDKINTEQSMAFSKMIVEGQSFAQATAHLWRDLAEQVIAQIEAMLVKYALLSAFTGGSMETAGMAGKLLGFSKQAEGGSYLVNKPTMFMAGEAGQPELATFTPLSKLGSGGQMSTGGSSSSVQIGTVQTNVYGLTNPDAIADKVGLKIAERIRGQGEINFTRPS